MMFGLVLVGQSVFAQPLDRRSTGGSQSLPVQQRGKVIGAQLRPLKLPAGRIKCPTKYTFFGSITTDGPAEVSYKWVSSDGKSWPVTTLKFSGKATKSVSVTWDVGKPGYEGSEWIRLEVISPNKVESTKTSFILHCLK